MQLKYPLIHKYYLIQWEKQVLSSFLSGATGISGENPVNEDFHEGNFNSGPRLNSGNLFYYYGREICCHNSSPFYFNYHISINNSSVFHLGSLSFKT